MSSHCPLVSSGTAGPLGALHLPRLWQKLSLDAAGKLSAEYPACGAGFDQMTLDGLGLDKDATIAFVNANKPTYPQFEAWVVANGSKVDEASIIEHNAAVSGYIHTDATRQEILTANGLPDGHPTDAVNLNNLDDWLEFHRTVIAG